MKRGPNIDFINQVEASIYEIEKNLPEGLQRLLRDSPFLVATIRISEARLAELRRDLEQHFTVVLDPDKAAYKGISIAIDNTVDDRDVVIRLEHTSPRWADR